jgi:hypothetical protein
MGPGSLTVVGYILPGFINLLTGLATPDGGISKATVGDDQARSGVDVFDHGA